MSMLVCLQNILQLILAPAKGWEDVAAAHTDNEQLLRRGMYPLIALAALSLFVQLIYVSAPLPLYIVRALVIFVSYFLTFYFSLMMFRSMFFHLCAGEPDEHDFTTMIAYSVCLLALSDIVCNVMPVKIGLQYLLSLAVALIMWKSDAFLHVAHDKNFLFVIFCILTTVVPPILIQTLFDLIL